MKEAGLKALLTETSDEKMELLTYQYVLFHAPYYASVIGELLDTGTITALVLQ